MRVGGCRRKVMADDGYPKVGHFEGVGEFRANLEKLGVELPVEEKILSAAEGSPMGQPLDVGGFRVGNRWVVHPMEGWDGTTSGEPTEHMLRRWEHFGESGCKWIWGGGVCGAGGGAGESESDRDC